MSAVPPVAAPVVVDASQLPSYAFGHRSVMWWGTAGVMLIEGTVFAMAVVTYFYIWTRVRTWPPGVPPPDLFWGTLNSFVMLVSVVPNHWTKRAAEHEHRGKVRIGMVVCILFAIAFVVIRAFEYAALNVRWDTNAYGSVAWLLLSLHTVHVVTDLWDSIVLGALSFTGPWEGRRFVDVAENAMYWYFVVLAWFPIYAVIYFAPRVL